MRRRPLPARILLSLACVVAIVAALGAWADRQLLDTDEWVSTSGQLLRDPAVQAATAAYLSDQVVDTPQVTAQIRDALPPRLAPLAGPLTAGAGELAERTVKRVISSGAFATVWDTTNRRAHDQLVAAVDDQDGVLASRGVVLDLRPELGVLAERIGVAPGATGPDHGRVRILGGQALDTVRTAVRILRDVRWGALALLVVLLVAGVALSGDRARGLGGAGVALVLAALGILVVRRLAGTYVVDQVSAHGAGQPAAAATWRIATSLLASIAVTALVFGLLLALGAWLASGAGWARAVRRFTAPVVVGHPELAFAAVVALLALLLLGGLLPTIGGAWAVLIYLALAGAGVLALRRTTARELTAARFTRAG
ncbi:MAG: hypothetical protein JWR63_251 [Conexibacter sp.]|nr:hypothetical protein [Conexibacter sp.]